MRIAKKTADQAAKATLAETLRAAPCAERSAKDREHLVGRVLSPLLLPVLVGVDFVVAVKLLPGERVAWVQQRTFNSILAVGPADDRVCYDQHW